LNITCSSVWHCLDKNLEVSPGTNTLTLICHGKGGMRAPGRCGRDTVSWREEAQRGAWIRPIRNNQPIRVLERGSPTRDMNSAYT